MSRYTEEDLPCRNPLCNDTVHDVELEWSGDGYYEPLESHLCREDGDICAICNGVVVTVTLKIGADFNSQLTCPHEWKDLVEEVFEDARLVEEATISTEDQTRPYTT